MLSLEKQEAYRRRYIAMCPSWRPSSQIYQDLVTGLLTPNIRVLDLGCGRGGVLERLHRQAASVTGIDPDLPSLQAHRAPAFPVFCGRAGALPYASESFDLVCCSWVLEHLLDPAVAFAEIRRVLSPGGAFAFLTPNARHPLLQINRLLAMTRGQMVRLLYDRAEADTFPAHYRANTVTRIDRLACAVGLRRVHVRFVGDPTYLAFNDALFRTSVWLERLIPRWLRVHLVGLYSAVG